MTLKSAGEFLLVEPIKDTETEGGLALPDSMFEKPKRGVVRSYLGDHMIGLTIYYEYARANIQGLDVVHENDVYAAEVS